MGFPRSRTGWKAPRRKGITLAEAEEIRRKLAERPGAAQAVADEHGLSIVTVEKLAALGRKSASP